MSRTPNMQAAPALETPRPLQARLPLAEKGMTTDGHRNTPPRPSAASHAHPQAQQAPRLVPPAAPHQQPARLRPASHQRGPGYGRGDQRGPDGSPGVADSRAGGVPDGTGVTMTSPADRPPPDPERGNPVRLRWARVLSVAAALCLLA